MPNFKTLAIGAMVTLGTLGASAGVLSSSNEAALQFVQTDLMAQSQRLDVLGNIGRPVMIAPTRELVTKPAAAEKAGHPHPAGMLITGLAVMGVVARRRWQSRG